MPITRLHFTNTGPFRDVDFDFDKQVNVFVGPNNAGKSTALLVLAEIMVYPFGFPTKLLRKDGALWRMTLQHLGRRRVFRGPLPIDMLNSKTVELLQIIGYSTFVPSIRRSTDFRSEGPLVDSARLSERQGEERSVRRSGPSITRVREALQISTAAVAGRRGDEEEPELRKRNALIATDPSLVSDEAVIRKMVELDYMAYRRNQPEIRKIIERIAEIASEVTEGFPMKFLGIGEDARGLFPEFKTTDGDFPLDVLSQGTQSVIQWIAHLLLGYAQYYEYSKDLEQLPGILIIDEIDAHIHPSWQRRIIPTLIKYFPNLQIFCSTHSPLMLAGLKRGQIHLFQRDGDGNVNVTKNELDIVGWSSDQILRNILEVEAPTDLATTQNLERLASLRKKSKLSRKEQDELDGLRASISEQIITDPINAQLEVLKNLISPVDASTANKSKPKPKPKGRASGRRSNRSK